MFTVLRNRITYSPGSSQDIGVAAAQQRLAYNAAVDFILAHPNVSRFDLQKQLTRWRAQNPARWHGNLRIQRSGLEQGRNAIRAFDKASLKTLRECEKERKLRQEKNPAGTRKPKHPVRPRRSMDPKRLYRRRKTGTTVSVDDHKAIRVENPRRITAAGLTLELARPLPPDANIRALNIMERRSSRSKGRNRPLSNRSYDLHLIIEVPDPEPKFPLANPTGVDVGVANTVSTADGRHFRQPDTELANQLETLRARQKRLKYKGRQWHRLQRQVRSLLRKHRNKVANWEHRVASEIARTHTLVAVEKLTLASMRHSARGTPENPGSKVKAKAGLNRSMTRARPGYIHGKLERHCEKNGTAFLRVRPQGTSQTCPLCGCRTSENRKSQAEFHCQRCRLSAHADTVAALNIRTLATVQALTALLLWAHGPDKQAATIRRRQGLPPLSDSLTLLQGRPGSKLDPSPELQPAKPAIRLRPLEPKLSL